MHFIATFCPFRKDYAFNTSEKVPSPSFRINLYLCMFIKKLEYFIFDFIIIWLFKSLRIIL